MTCWVRRPAISFFIAIIMLSFIMLSFLGPDRTAQAQTAAPSPFASTGLPSFDPELLKPPKAKPDGSAAKLDSKPAGKTTPDIKIPSRIDLGKYDLEFRAGHTSEINPRAGFDSGETSNLSKVTPGKQESVTPNYFGLKLIAPTH